MAISKCHTFFFGFFFLYSFLKFEVTFWCVCWIKGVVLLGKNVTGIKFNRPTVWLSYLEDFQEHWHLSLFVYPAFFPTRLNKSLHSTTHWNMARNSYLLVCSSLHKQLSFNEISFAIKLISFRIIHYYWHYYNLCNCHTIKE